MDKERIKFSIVLPCYNEEQNISLILEKFDRVINREDIEVIFVENGSTDQSEDVFKSLLPKYSFARVIKIEKNIGYGFGVTSGLKAARGEFIGYTHADLQTDPVDVLKAFTFIERHENPRRCYIKGDRKGRPFLDKVFTVGMSIFETLYLRTRLWDINAQPNIFHRSFFVGMINLPLDFSIDLYFLYMAKKQGLDVLRFDVVFPTRVHGESSWNKGIASKWKFIKRTLKMSFKLRRML